MVLQYSMLGISFYVVRFHPHSGHELTTRDRTSKSGKVWNLAEKSGLCPKWRGVSSM